MKKLFVITALLGVTFAATAQNDSKNGSGSDGFVPVMAGIKYNFTEKVFAAGQLGLMFSTASGGGSAFTYSPGVGYQISSNISALVKYTGWSKNSVNGSMVGLRLAYSF